MSLWSRIANVVRGDRLSREIDEEIKSHIEEAIEGGRDPAEARKAFGCALRHREESRDIRLIPWLDSFRADAVFGWRQLRKNKITSAAAVLSLALAIGACTSAFRLIDALLLRPLPVANPDRLHIVTRHSIADDGETASSESLSYPLFREMRAAALGKAELLAVSYAERRDLTYGSDQEMEKVHQQFVSGPMFESFGLRPALGRLFTATDDRIPGAHPYAVLSYDYWKRRFGQDPTVLGRTFRMGQDLYEIVGVVEERFSGTEPGTLVDLFVPAMMKARVINQPYSWWLRSFVRPAPGVSAKQVSDILQAPFQAFQKERLKEFGSGPEERLNQLRSERISVEPAAAGVSGMQKRYRLALTSLAVLVALVLLIACANVGNLMAARAKARAREMSLRVSIGAGRARLVRLVLVESTWIAFFAAAVGSLFAWWSAPFVVSLINTPESPARLVLPADWRVLGFGLGLTFGVTLLFGLSPALQASAVRPMTVLKGGESPHSRRRLMLTLVAAQVAFCFIVLFIGGLFVATYDRIANEPTGFSAEHLLTLDTVTAQPQLPVYWDEIAAHLRTVPGVEAVALAGWPLLSNQGWNGFISVDGAVPANVLCDFLHVSPGWLEVMRIPLLDGRDFRSGDTHPGVAIVNESFAKTYFDGQNPVGKWFQRGGTPQRLQIVGLVRDARYWNMRDPIGPGAYFPFQAVDGNGALQRKDESAFIVRTSSPDPLTLAPVLRRSISNVRSEFRVSNVRTQKGLNEMHTVRERLLAMLALFFAATALVLAAVGLFGVLDHSVLQRRREIGIRMALGAPAAKLVRAVTLQTFATVLLGAVVGLGLGISSERYIETLLYGVSATDLGMLALPSAAILGAALLAAIAPVVRAVRLNPVETLRPD
jgi:predicted permease